MYQRAPNKRLLAITAVAAALAVAFAAAPALATAQDTTSAGYHVLINGVYVGSAIDVSTQPVAAVPMHQDSNPNMPSKQLAASEQATVTLTTADPILIAAVQSWVKTDNTGFKDTVQRKTVEIDHMVPGPNARQQLIGAWPSKVSASGVPATITFVYQQLAPIT